MMIGAKTASSFKQGLLRTPCLFASASNSGIYMRMMVKTLHGVCSLKSILLSIHGSLLLLLHFPLDIVCNIEKALSGCVTHRAFRALGIVL